MALTLEVEQRLEDVGLIAFYQRDEAAWLGAVRDTRDYVVRGFPEGARVRQDDVAKALVIVLEVHEGFKDYRDRETLRPKYWIRHFADLLVDRTWDRL